MEPRVPRPGRRAGGQRILGSLSQPNPTPRPCGCSPSAKAPGGRSGPVGAGDTGQCPGQVGAAVASGHKGAEAPSEAAALAQVSRVRWLRSGVLHARFPLSPEETWWAGSGRGLSAWPGWSSGPQPLPPPLLESSLQHCPAPLPPSPDTEIPSHPSARPPLPGGFIPA